MKKIGSLWINKSKEGMTYLSGNVEIIAGMPQKIAIFKNEKKDKPNQPDWQIVLSEIQKEIKEDNKENKSISLEL